MRDEVVYLGDEVVYLCDGVVHAEVVYMFAIASLE